MPERETVYFGNIYLGTVRGSIVRFLFCFGWILFAVSGRLRHAGDPWSYALLVCAAVLYAAATAASVQVALRLPRPYRVWVVVAVVALSFILWPALGGQVCDTWVFAGLVIGVSGYTVRTSLLIIAGLVAATIACLLLDGTRGDALFLIPAIVASVSIMVLSVSRQRQAFLQLRATQQELARLAVEQERGRVARDIHDVLGHSLTAVTVKTELASMLIEAGRTAQAAAEIAEVERIARGALADVRATVAGYRGTSVVSELANARSILGSAGIEAELPTTVEMVPPERRELMGWVIREGVTNVLRHSRAAHCRVRIDADSVEIADDGIGPRDAAGSGRTDARGGDRARASAPGRAGGSGLAGLRDRLAAHGGSLTVGRSDLGGYRLLATLGAGS